MYPGLFAGAANINQPPQPQLEMIYLYIPENTVGAVIGSKGLNIKNIMRISGARIKVRYVRNLFIFTLTKSGILVLDPFVSKYIYFNS